MTQQKHMLKRLIKYTLWFLLLFFLVYNSIYFKKLDRVKLASTTKEFNAAAYARSFYNNLLPHLDSAVVIDKLIPSLKTEPDKTFSAYSHALDIGNIRYFLVRGEGTILSIDEDAVTVALKDNSIAKEIRFATEFVYGNAIRDASGRVNLNEFSKTFDFNAISEEINKIVRKEVIPPFKANAKPGNTIRFSGAIELNQVHLNIDSIEIIPIQLAILNN